MIRSITNTFQGFHTVWWVQYAPQRAADLIFHMFTVLEWVCVGVCGRNSVGRYAGRASTLLPGDSGELLSNISLFGDLPSTSSSNFF